MLWLIGALSVLIDIFYRVSVPIDQVLEASHPSSSWKSTTEEPFPSEDLDLSKSVKIGNEELAELINSFNLKSPAETRAIILHVKEGLQSAESNRMPILIASPPATTTSKPEEVLQLTRKSIEASSTIRSSLPPMTSPIIKKEPSHPLKKSSKRSERKDPSISTAEQMYRGKVAEPRGVRQEKDTEDSKTNVTEND